MLNEPLSRLRNDRAMAPSPHAASAHFYEQGIAALELGRHAEAIAALKAGSLEVRRLQEYFV